MPHGLIIRKADNKDEILRNAQATGAATATSSQGPMLINETWAAAIDTTNRWSSGIGGTGVVAVISSGNYRVCRCNCPAAADIARFSTAGLFTKPSGASVTNNIFQRLILEWDCWTGTVANINNPTFFMGMTAAVGSSRGTNDILGFYMASDIIRTLTDSGGTETTNAVTTAPTMTDVNRFKIVVSNGSVEFHINNVLQTTHTTNIYSGVAACEFYMEAEAGTGATSLLVPSVRLYYLDYV